MIATRAVQVSIVLDRRVPVESHRAIATPIAVAPDFLKLAAGESYQGTAEFVGLGDEHLIPDNHGGRGIYALQDLRAPRKPSQCFPLERIDGQEAAAGKHENEVALVHLGRGRAGITCEIV